MGLDSGIIHRFECPKEKNLLLMKELPEVTVHNTMQRVMGISVDPRVNHLFSISESGYLIVTDLSKRSENTGCKFISSRNLSATTGLKAMIHDFQRNLLFIADGSGSVFILNSIPTEPELIVAIQTDQKVCIRGLTRSVNTFDYWP